MEARHLRRLFPIFIKLCLLALIVAMLVPGAIAAKTEKETNSVTGLALVAEGLTAAVEGDRSGEEIGILLSAGLDRLNQAWRQDRREGRTSRSQRSGFVRFDALAISSPAMNKILGEFERKVGVDRAVFVSRMAAAPISSADLEMIAPKKLASGKISSFLASAEVRSDAFRESVIRKSLAFAAERSEPEVLASVRKAYQARSASFTN